MGEIHQDWCLFFDWHFSFQLHKTLNENLEDVTFEQIMVFDRIICTSRQATFQISWRNNVKIGMNTTANNFFALSNLIWLQMLNLTFVHLKKLAKIKFLKYGKTKSNFFIPMPP